MEKLKVVTLCSGYDSQCLALERLKNHYPDFDYELIAWSEFDPESKQPLHKQPAVIAHNALFPQWADRNLGDMTKIDWEKVPDFDLLFYSTPCFIAGTSILTDKGYKPIEEIAEDDMVLTHTNTFRPVLKVGMKPASNIINVRTMMSDGIRCTPNHPFYTRELFRYAHKRIRAFKQPVWKPAGELNKKDYLGIPVNNISKLPIWGGTILHRGTHWDSVNELCKVLDKEDFWYVMGRYLGDGWQRYDDTHKAILIAAYDKGKRSLIQSIENLGWNYTTTSERTCNRVTIYGKELCEFVNRFGKYAHGKHIDEDTINLPKNLLTAFLEGYIDSDGCFNQGEYKISTVSRNLAYDITRVVAKCYNRPSRLYVARRPQKHIIEKRIVNQRDFYIVQWHTDNRKQDKAFYEDGYIWYPIKEIVQTERNEFVYNLEVRSDHSYIANNAIVHNCQSISSAGLQHGFTEGSGTRSSIIWNVRDAVKIKKPKFLCLENVKAMVSKKFKPMFNLWQQELENLGYTNFAKVLNAKDYGVAQNRERIFLVSIRNDDAQPSYHFPEPFPLQRLLEDYLEPEVDESFYISDEYIQRFQFSDDNEEENCE